MKINQIKLGAILSYLSIGINILAGLIYTPWMIGQIGKSDYGLFTLANSLITLFLVDFGLSSATARFVSNYHAEGRQDKVNSFLGTVYKLYLLVDAVIFAILIVLYFFIDTIYIKLTPAELEKFKIVYVIAATYALVNFPFITLNGILTAYEKFIQLKLSELIYRFLVIAMMVVALLNGMGLYALVTVNALAGLIIIVYKLIIINRSTTVRVKFEKQNKGVYKEIFGFSVWVTITSLAQRLVFNIVPSILGIVANSATIAVFGIVTTIEGYSYTITSAINGMFMPRISRIYAGKDDEKDIMPLMLKIGRFQYVLNGLIIVGFAAVGKEFITLWMGNDYLDSYYGIVLVIIPGLFFNSLQIANTAMIVANKVKYQAIITTVTGVVNIAFSFPLSYFYGVIGACASIFIAYMLRAILYLIVYKKVMNLDIIRFISKCYLRMFPPIFITLIFGFLFSFIEKTGWIYLGIKGIAVIMVYVISIFIFGISTPERKHFYNIFKKKLIKR